MAHVEEKKSSPSKILEQGDVFFFYRPKTQSAEQENDSIEKLKDIQRFYMVLHPEKQSLFRLIIIGKKKLPEATKPGEVAWATIEAVNKKPQPILSELREQRYDTKTRGKRIKPEARAAGEGIYCLAEHEGHTHFAYALELPSKIAEVQQELSIEPESSYIIAVKNQTIAGTTTGDFAQFPEHLREKFQDRRFIPLETPDFLNYDGAELLLIGTTTKPDKELGISFQAERETHKTADIFNELKLRKKTHIIKPLFEGKWQ